MPPQRAVRRAALCCLLCAALALSAAWPARAETLPDALARVVTPYPGSVVSDVMQAPGTASALMVAEASLDEVAAFLRQDIVERGFAVDLEQRTQDAMALRAKDEQGRTLTLDMRREGGLCNIRIVLAEQGHDLDMGGLLGYPEPLAQAAPPPPCAELVDARVSPLAVTAFLQCPGGMDEVYAFFRDQLLARGWTLSMELAEDEMAVLGAVRGEQELYIDLGLADDMVLVQLRLTPGVLPSEEPAASPWLGDMGMAEAGAVEGPGRDAAPALVYPAALEQYLPLPLGAEVVKVTNMMDTLMVDVALPGTVAQARDYYVSAMESAGLTLGTDMLEPELAVLAAESRDTEYYVNIGASGGRTMAQIMASPKQ